jgi:peptidoglycan/xylan/chitin deacetylase (PgdA/CDA1 family)
MWAINRRVKALLGNALYRTGTYRKYWRNRAVIVVFHRIDDRYPSDPITCGVKQFNAYCDFFQRYFIVVSLGELLDKLRDGADISRHLVITFDDGYLDNARTAAVELKRRKLPACFFVTTGFLGTTTRAWWDRMRFVPSQWMSWDDVRQLHAEGFEIAPHTVTHPDLAYLSGAGSVSEILGSKEQLERELGVPARYFCYPFGGSDQISEENLALVRNVGFRCCFSACGGTVHPGADVYNLKRTSIISWYASPYQFGFEVLRNGH